MKVEAHTYELGYPAYAAKFLANDVLVVVGGGGEGSHGIPNRLTALRVDFKKRKVLRKFREITLSSEDDSPTTLDIANNVLLMGCNESHEAIVNGSGNRHLRKYIYENEHLRFAGSVDLDGSRDPEEYTKLTSMTQDATVGAIASSRNPTTIRIIDPRDLVERYEIETGREVRDLHFSPDGKILSYITSSSLEVVSIVTGRFFLRKTDFDKNWSLSKVSFLNDDTVLLCAIGKKNYGLYMTKICMKSGKATVTKSRLVSSKFKTIISMDVNHEGKTAVVAGNDNMVALINLETFKVLQYFNKLHEFAVTKVLFSPDSRLVASVSAASTVHVMRFPKGYVSSGSFLRKIWNFILTLFKLTIVVLVGHLIYRFDLHKVAYHYLSNQKIKKPDISSYFKLKNGFSDDIPTNSFYASDVRSSEVVADNALKLSDHKILVVTDGDIVTEITTTPSDIVDTKFHVSNSGWDDTSLISSYKSINELTIRSSDSKSSITTKSIAGATSDATGSVEKRLTTEGEIKREIESETPEILSSTSLPSISSSNSIELESGKDATGGFHSTLAESRNDNIVPPIYESFDTDIPSSRKSTGYITIASQPVESSETSIENLETMLISASIENAPNAESYSRTTFTALESAGSAASHNANTLDFSSSMTQSLPLLGNENKTATFQMSGRHLSEHNLSSNSGISEGSVSTEFDSKESHILSSQMTNSVPNIIESSSSKPTTGVLPTSSLMKPNKFEVMEKDDMLSSATESLTEESLGSTFFESFTSTDTDSITFNTDDSSKTNAESSSTSLQSGILSSDSIKNTDVTGYESNSDVNFQQFTTSTTIITDTVMTISKESGVVISNDIDAHSTQCELLEENGAPDSSKSVSASSLSSLILTSFDSTSEEGSEVMQSRTLVANSFATTETIETTQVTYISDELERENVISSNDNKHLDIASFSDSSSLGAQGPQSHVLQNPKISSDLKPSVVTSTNPSDKLSSDGAFKMDSIDTYKTESNPTDTDIKSNN